MRAEPFAEAAFASLGTTVRVVVWGERADALAAAARAEVEACHAALSRFEPGSELSRLNADPGAVVRASPRLRGAIRAALWAATRSGGLADPCLLDAVLAAGYRRSLAGAAPARAVPAGPVVPARPHPAAAWRSVRVDDAAEVIARPPGLRLDLGGSAKGWIADQVADALARGAERWFVDCGGDLRLGGCHEVGVEHPLTGELAARLVADGGAVATSAVSARAWRRPDGTPAHHLLDPSTGRPARTGVLAATACARTALEAETLAKTALLSGPERGRRLLARGGGLLVDETGRVERVGAWGGTRVEKPSAQAAC